MRQFSSDCSLEPLLYEEAEPVVCWRRNLQMLFPVRQQSHCKTVGCCWPTAKEAAQMQVEAWERLWGKVLLILKMYRLTITDRKDLVISRPESYRPVKQAKVVVDLKKA